MATAPFQTAINYIVPSASSVAIGDLTGDKKPELVVSSYYDGTVWVLLNKGSGNFQALGCLLHRHVPQSMVLADFNGDKKLDFVVGNATGQFVTDCPRQWRRHLPGQSCITTKAVVDVDHTASRRPISTSTATSTSSRPAAAPAWVSASCWGLPTACSRRQRSSTSAPPPGLPIAFVRAIDVNGDGKPDIVCGTPKGVVVLLGSGTGTFKTPVTYAVSPSSYPIVGWLADLNGDGKPDIVTSNHDGTVSVLLNKGNGTYGTATVFPSGTGAYPSGFAVGDFNQDGKPDIVVGDFQASDLVLLLGNGNGTFQSPVVLPSPVRPSGLTAADLNKDGKLDLAIASGDNSGSLAILLGNGNGTFTPGNTYQYFDDSTCIIYGACDHYPYSLVAVDLNGDNNLDLAIAPRNPWYKVCGAYRCAEQYLGAVVYLGKGDGTFVEQSGWLAGVSPTWVVAGDFNSDGMPDLAFLQQSEPQLRPTSVTILQNATQPVSVSPRSVTFAGTKNVGTSASQTVILTNNQSTKLTISSIVVTGSEPRRLQRQIELRHSRWARAALHDYRDLQTHWCLSPARRPW